MSLEITPGKCREVRVSAAETVNDEKAEVSGQYSGPQLMLSEQVVMETPTPKEIRREALTSTREVLSKLKENHLLQLISQQKETYYAFERGSFS